MKTLTKEEVANIFRKCLEKNQDPWTAIAAEVFETVPSKVTQKQRLQIKKDFQGVVYGAR